MKQTKEERAAYMKKYNKKYNAEYKDNPMRKAMSAVRSKKWYAQHKEESRLCRKKWRVTTRQRWLEFLHSDKMKCQVCGYDKCFSALEFHHSEPGRKDFGIGVFMHKAFNEKNKQLMLKELGKCICMCANCHREFHAMQRKLQDETERSKEDIK